MRKTFAGAVLLRARRHLLQLAGLAAVLVPTAASAQAVNYLTFRRPTTYQELAGAPLSVSGDAGNQIVSLPFPVRYWGNQYSSLTVNANMWASFTHTSNEHWPDGFSSSSSPNGMIAVFWADAVCPTPVLAETLGTAPNRQYVIQWDCHEYQDTAARVKAQLWLTEGSSAIEVRYGAATGSWDEGAMGIESPTGNARVYGVNCGITCNSQHVPVGESIFYVRNVPDLRVTGVTAPERAWGGIELPIEATVDNQGGVNAGNFQVAYYLSANTTLEPGSDILLGTRDIAGPLGFRDAAALQERDFIVPPDTPAGTYYVLVQVDSTAVIVEELETNNVASYGPITVAEPTPDLVVTSMTLPQEPQIDGTLDFKFTVRNRGAAPATNVPYTIVASSNDYNSTYDVILASRSLSIAALVDLEIVEAVELPEALNAGGYHIGVIIDPDNVLFESDETNNLYLSSDRALLGSDHVASALLDLPAAHVGSPYCVHLKGAGGDGTYVWSVVGGELPPGLSLEEERVGADLTEPPLATMLCGSPSKVGSYHFTLQVESAGRTARSDYDLEVVPASGVPVTIATRSLHDAFGLEAYWAQLNAVGGVPPYEWALVSGALPAGLKLDRTGRIQGVPTEVGTRTFTVRVTDSAGNSDQVQLSLIVAPPTRITCMTQTLETMPVGVDVGTELYLQAAGGQAPYEWKTIESRRLPGPLDPGETYSGAEPPGLILSGSGQVRGKPSFAGRYLWMVSVTGSNSTLSDTCAISFEVTYEQGITVTTTSLADAYAGVPYEAFLEAIGGTGDMTWYLPEGGGGLPTGLVLDEKGTLTGVLPLSALGGAKSKVFPFTVLVRDSENRIGAASLSIRLYEQKPAQGGNGGGDSGGDDGDGGGCQTAGADPSLMALAAALALTALQRRG